jgi:hypothetical protein
MRTRFISPRADAMAWWRIGVLAVLAMAVGAGIFVFARRSAEQSAATAQLSFDPAAAIRNDAALAHARQPAVDAAQSILTESVVLDVLRKAGASPSDAIVGIGEFRSGLDLREPSVQTLRVLYRDPDPRKARIVANAVATAIAEWAPPALTQAAPSPAAAAVESTSGPPIQPASQPGSRTASSAPSPAPAAQRHDPLPPAYSTLADLEGRLAAVDERLGVLAGQPESADRPLYPSPLTAAQTEQLRRLEAQLAEALRKLDDLRARSGGDESDPSRTEHTIAELQHELAAFPPPASATSHKNAESKAGSDVGQLRLERGRLTDQIAAEKQTIVRLRAHPAVTKTAPPVESASAPLPPPPRVAPVVVAASAPTPAATPVWQNPFRIARLAIVTPRSLAFPSLLAGILCALYCVAAAFGLFLYARRAIETAPQAETALAPVPSAGVAAQASRAPSQPDWQDISSLYIPEDVEPIARPAPALQPQPGGEPAHVKQFFITDREKSRAYRNSFADSGRDDAEWNERFLQALALDRERLAAEPRGGPANRPTGPSLPLAADAAERQAASRSRQETSSGGELPPRFLDTLRLGSFRRRHSRDTRS